MAAPSQNVAAVQAAYNAALKQQQAGDLKAARKAYLAILKTRPLAEPMFQLGRIAEAQKDPKSAANWYRRALKLKPKEPALWQALVSVTRGKEREKALAQAKAAGVTVQGGAPMARGDALLSQGKFAEAKAAYRQVIRDGAPALPVLVQMSQRFRAAGALDEALTLAEEALAKAPDNPPALIARGGAHLDAKRMDLARADFRAALDHAPYHGAAWSQLISSQKQGADSADLARLEALVADGVSDPRAARAMSFALAKGLEDQGRYDAAVPHLTRANRMTAAAFPYGFEADLTRAHALQRSWTPVEGGYAEAAPIFVTGLPRSGTTLVETILSKHADVAAGGEMALFQRTITPVIDQAIAGQTPPPDAWAKAGAAYAAAARQSAGAAPRITDKSISTFSMIGHVANALPRAKFVVLERDRRDVGLSIYKNMFPEGTHRYANDLSELGRYIRLFDACVAAWQAKLPDRIYQIDYAALTADPEPEIRALLAFCELSWDPACLAPETSDRNVKTLSYAQVRQPINRGSVGAWRRYEEALQPLFAALDAHDFDLTD